jgi:hypothetical protein
MLQFIRLTSRVINKAHIIEITKSSHDKYSIHMSNININGSFLFFYTRQNVIEICKVADPQDYNSITNFIHTI